MSSSKLRVSMAAKALAPPRARALQARISSSESAATASIQKTVATAARRRLVRFSALVREGSG